MLGTYLLVITSREEAGTFLGFPIFRVTAMKFLPCNGNLRFATAQEVSLFFFCKVSIFGVFFFKLSGMLLVACAEKGRSVFQDSVTGT